MADVTGVCTGGWGRQEEDRGVPKGIKVCAFAHHIERMEFSLCGGHCKLFKQVA